MSVLLKLQSAQTLKDLAAILGYKPAGLSFIVYTLPSVAKYKKFKIPKKSGGEREISAPAEPLKTLQRRLANVLYACRDEIDANSKRKSLSHGFRRKHSIITNARRHKRRRYVLNIDLQDFFPTFNFGRVRGYFIHNNDFKFSDKVATIIAQIACFENSLPQGSPCSPIIADLIAHLLDVRLAQLAKQNQLTYSRYADDITFSTSRRDFPPEVAAPLVSGSPDWEAGKSLAQAVQKAGFVINPAKTRMHFRMSRQLVTGLTVNAKVNIRVEYYKRARAMCDSIFETGTYHLPLATAAVGALAKTISSGAASVAPVPPPSAGRATPQPAVTPAPPVPVSSLLPLYGILSHIHHVKDAIDGRGELEKRKNPTAARALYARFLKYRSFVRLELPLIVCEGKTDNIYLKYAIRHLTAFHPKLGEWSGKTFKSGVRFFNYAGEAHRILELGGGAGDLRYFFIKSRYKNDIQGFNHRPLKHPVIVLIDNDDAAKDLFATLNNNFSIPVTLQSNKPFYRVTDNLYLVKTLEYGATGKSCIEDFFEPTLLQTELSGKKFNPNKDQVSAGEYGKYWFAEKVVRPNAGAINFSKFAPLLDRIVAVIDDYSPPATK